VNTSNLDLSKKLELTVFGDLAFLIALKSYAELRLHTKGAIRNGISVVEIREVVLQSMIYCGVPAGVEAMRQTEQAIKEMVDAGECKGLE